jgi:hypothetical protein
MIDQKTAALLIATANTAAQLVQLRKAKPFSMFDNDYTGFRHINADFDNGCRDKQLRCAIAECLHRAIAFTSFHFAMRKGNSDIGKGVRQRGKPVFSRGNVQLVRFFNKRANPIGAFSRAKRAAKAGNDIAQTVTWQNARVNWQPANRFFVKAGMIKIAIGGHGEASWNRRCGHHHYINMRTFFTKQNPLAHAKPVLFVNNRQTKIVKRNGFR